MSAEKIKIIKSVVLVPGIGPYLDKAGDEIIDLLYNMYMFDICKELDLKFVKPEYGYLMYCYGHYYEHFKLKPIEALTWYSMSSGFGYTKGLNKIASYYMKGQFVNQDVSQALTLYQRSIDLGDTQAMVHLAHSYLFGEEPWIKKDVAQAIDLYFKAMTRGNGYAMWFLGYCYQNGLGLPQNNQTAQSLYIEASKVEPSLAMNVKI